MDEEETASYLTRYKSSGLSIQSSLASPPPYDYVSSASEYCGSEKLFGMLRFKSDTGGG